MLVISTYRITGLHYTYGCRTFRAAYVGYHYVVNKCVTLLLLVSHLKCSLSLHDQPRESLSYPAPIGVEPYEQPIFIGSTYRITLLHLSYRCAILSAAYLCNVYFENHWVTVHLWVSHLLSSLCQLALPT